MTRVRVILADGSAMELPDPDTIRILGAKHGAERGWFAIRYGIGQPGQVATWTDPNNGAEHFLNLALVMKAVRQ